MKNITALISCFIRCYHTKVENDKVYDDPYSLKILSEDEYESISNYMRKGISFFNKNYNGNDPLKFIVNTYLAPSVLIRSKLCEEILNEKDFEQYLILASGYDTSGYKVNDRVKVFELDKKEVIEDKKRRVLGANIDTKNINYISADFNEGWIKTLLSSEFDKSKRTLCSLLGISYYLEKGTFLEMVDTVSSIVPGGSVIIFDYPNELTEPQNTKMVLAQGAGELMRSIYTKNDITNILVSSNMTVYKNLDYKDVSKYFYKYNKNCDIKMNAPKDVSYCVLINKRNDIVF